MSNGRSLAAALKKPDMGTINGTIFVVPFLIALN
jgi:hypothetical protein